MELSLTSSTAYGTLSNRTAIYSKNEVKLSHTAVRRLSCRAADEDDDFEARLEKLRRKGASGTGKKAEERKARAEGVSPPAPAAASTSTGVSPLKPIPLEDPISDGLPVALGFSEYSERVNGRFAALGIVALVAVELVSGESILKFHDPATLMLQIYTLLSVGAVVVKLEREKNSVWPK